MSSNTPMKRRRMNDDADMNDFNDTKTSDTKVSVRASRFNRAMEILNQDDSLTMEQKVMRLFQEMNVNPNSSDDDKEEDYDQERFYDVKKILNHRLDEKGEWSFLVQFCDKTEYWIPDRDCCCESLISEYLAREVPNVRTIYGFCRVSTKKQESDDRFSLQSQEQILRQTIQQLLQDEKFKDFFMRVKIVRTAESAYKKIPKNLVHITECARQGDVLTICYIDRLSRNIVKFLGLLEDLNNRGVYIYSQDENLWYHENYLQFFKAIVAAHEQSFLMGKKIKQSLAYRRQQGHAIGPIKFGYRKIRDSNNIVRHVEDDHEMHIIEYITKRVSKKPRKIAELLNRKRLLRRGKEWTPSMVRYILNQEMTAT